MREFSKTRENRTGQARKACRKDACGLQKQALAEATLILTPRSKGADVRNRRFGTSV